MFTALKYLFISSAVALSLSAPLALAEQTAPNSDGGGNAIYLDRHYLNCNNRGMAGFRLFRPTRNTIAYQFNCRDAPIGAGAQRFTLPNDDGKGNMIFLDRHNVSCGNTALVSFGLYRPNPTTIGYQYWCGSTPLGTVTNHETRATENGGGNVLYLDRQNVQCGQGVLTGFQLFRPTENTIAYAYSCGR